MNMKKSVALSRMRSLTNYSHPNAVFILYWTNKVITLISNFDAIFKNMPNSSGVLLFDRCTCRYLLHVGTSIAQ